MERNDIYDKTFIHRLRYKWFLADSEWIKAWKQSVAKSRKNAIDHPIRLRSIRFGWFKFNILVNWCHTKIE